MKRRTILLSPLLALPAALLYAQATPDVCAIGDSITVGVGASTPARSYVALVCAALGWSVENLATGGSTIATQQPQIAAAAAPLTIWLTGYNDMRAGTPLDTYAMALDAAITTLTAGGRTLYLGDCLRMPQASYTAFGPQWAYGSDAAVVGYNATIAAVGRGRAVLVDAGAAYDPVTMCGSDGGHPNDAGHQAIAEAFLGEIRRRAYAPLVGYPAP